MNLPTSSSSSTTPLRRSELEDLWALIGNIIRLAVAVDPADAKLACDAAACSTLHAVLLEPRQSPPNPRDDMVNYMLLQAFVEFRRDVEHIRAIALAGDRDVTDAS